jgi:hypothetical protein
VSNAWVIYLQVRNNTPKGVLIPDMTAAIFVAAVKDGLSMEAIA